MGVERWEKAPNGGKPKKQKGVTSREQLTKKARSEGVRRALCAGTNALPNSRRRASTARGLLIQCRTKHSNEEMRKMRSALVHLQPTHDTMIGEVFSDARFRNTQMLGQLRLDGCFPAACGTPPQKIRNGHPKGLASLNVVVGGLVRIGQQPDTRPRRRPISILYLRRRASQQAPEVHLELREP